MSALRVTAFAKINLSLEILGKRKDGFHEVCSVMQSISLADELIVEGGDDIALQCEVETLGGEGNLVVKAARALRRIHQGEPAAHIGLHKEIPVAAGLGGASADAAAVLVALSRLWRMELPRAELAPLAAGLGSDVPFFLFGGTALASGRGEVIRPLPDLVPRWLVLLVPPHSLAAKTAELYRRLRPDCWSSGAMTARLSAQIAEGKPVEDDFLGNSFEKVADEVFPSLIGDRRAMPEAGAGAVHLSGAGPAIFSLVKSAADAKAIAARLQKFGYQPKVARTLTAEEAKPQPVALSVATQAK